MLQIKVVNSSSYPLPRYQTEGSSGLDLHAVLGEQVKLKPLERKLIPTGLYIEIPEGYEAQVRSRSGLAVKHGIFCLNSPGTIDSDYRGEIKVILMNLSDQEFIIENNDRIAQLVFCKIEKITWLAAETVDNTNRGGGGFGHTGK
ncbi:MAG: deoxyuridine 5'-triphosphate nucleotidohydrolase [Spirochaetes bacterium GWF1_41_5]|nr:MAG: deoxyuridine 5'-triphosphate nucleotidohydrolase [Spirochaetes bacterium GWF1_41_5]HBD94977.1 dUTP diphosphatase [Spirochaetia bacterium]